MNLPSDWQQVVRVALLGTRQSGELVPSLADLPTPEPREEQTLLAAGALALVRKAGFKAPDAPAPAGPLALPETRPTLGPQGKDVLQQLLSERYPALLQTYLVSLAQAGRRVPHQLLVPLLTYAATRPELHAPTTAVLGERGIWLARLNPEWQSLLGAAAAPDQTVWETGTLRQRQTYLETLRQQHPDEARQLLAASLPQEPAKTQAALLATLAFNLNAADAPLLEQYLASKSKEVRQTVAPLLVRAPGNDLVERLWQRAQSFLTLKSPFLRGKKLEVTLPDAWSPDWQADGIEQKDSRFTGEKAAWLGQILALIPPERWTTHWGILPADLLELAASGEWATLLLPAWQQALLLHRSAAWALAYLHLQLTQDNVPPLPTEKVAGLLGPAQFSEILLNHLPHAPRLSQTEARWEQLLTTTPGPWPEALTMWSLGAIKNTLAAPGNTPLYMLYYRLTQLLHHMQLAVPPEHYDLCATALNDLGETDTGLHNAIGQFLEALHFRQQLHQTLTEPPAPAT